MCHHWKAPKSIESQHESHQKISDGPPVHRRPLGEKYLLFGHQSCRCQVLKFICVNEVRSQKLERLACAYIKTSLSYTAINRSERKLATTFLLETSLSLYWRPVRKGPHWKAMAPLPPYHVMGTKATKYILRFYVRRHGARNETLLSDDYHNTD